LQSFSQITSPPTNPTPNFLLAGCPSCRPTNSVTALTGEVEKYNSHAHSILWTYVRNDYHTTTATTIIALLYYQVISGRRKELKLRNPKPQVHKGIIAFKGCNLHTIRTFVHADLIPSMNYCV